MPVHFPESLLRELQEKFSIQTEPFLEAHEKTVPVSIRLNPLKPACGFELGGKVPWSAGAHYLNERPIFTNDPLFHAGCYYVQEASSMFVEEAVKQTVELSQKIIALDACAAPGGKSTLLASLLNNESLLVSNEVISTRVPVLVHNMVKWGTTNSVVSNNDPKDLSRLPGFFDLMVVDAPCSGSGLFRKQANAIEHWSEENVKHCSLRQQRILYDLVPALKENGILIYSTCSYSEEENENRADELISELGMEPLQLKIRAEWGIVETRSKKGGFGYRFFPHRAKGEGFFLACFRKISDRPDVVEILVRSSEKDKNRFFANLTREEEKAASEFIPGDNFEFAKFFEEIIACPKVLANEIKTIVSALKIKKMSLHVGQLKGKDFIPHPYTAYLSCLSDKISRAEVNEEYASKFLRKQDIQLPGAPKGFVRVSYKNFGLGWAKNLGNRINSYFPAEWRILKQEF